MPNPSSLAAYDDVKAVLDAALDQGLPMLYKLPSGPAAIRWRSRANSFRKLSSVTAYKTLVFSIKKEAPETIVITANEVGTLLRPDGTEVPLEVPAPTMTDEERAAFELAKELGIG